MNRHREVAVDRSRLVTRSRTRDGGLPLAADWLGSGRRAQTTRTEFVSQLIRTDNREPLSMVFPSLSSNARIPYEGMSVRVRNCFLRHPALVTWRDFCECSVLDLLQVRNAGVLSVSELLERALVEAITLGTVAGVKCLFGDTRVALKIADNPSWRRRYSGSADIAEESQETYEGRPSELDVANVDRLAQWAYVA